MTDERTGGKTMHVFVAGAAGAIGKRLVPQLRQRGHEVTASTRKPDKSEELRALAGRRGGRAGAAGRDRRSDDRARRRPRPAAIRPLVRRHQRAPDQGTDNLLSAARAAEVPRFIAQSYTGWTNPATGGPVKTERDGFDPQPPKAQRESLAAIRYLEDTVTAAPLAGIVLRYGNFYGPGASEALVELIRKRRFPLVGDGGGVWSWIHLDDAAAATVAALERGSRGVYNVVDDDPAPASEWLPYLAEVVGAKPPMRVPAWLARLMAGSVAVRWMTEGRGSSNAKAMRELDWRLAWGSWRVGFEKALEDRAQRPRLVAA
jgi:nucleoside-diphosphate-sugar epimerase